MDLKLFVLYIYLKKGICCYTILQPIFILIKLSTIKSLQIFFAESSGYNL